MSEVPEEYRSKTPDQLRELVEEHEAVLPPSVLQALCDSAAEIEGGEDAYAAVVEQNRELRKKLLEMERNLRSTLAMIPRARP